MKLLSCPHEEKLVRQLKESRATMDPMLLDHASGCSRCGKTLMTIEMLRKDRETAVLAAGAGSPRDIWRRAQWERRHHALEQMAGPVIWAETLALVGTLLAVAGVVFAWRRQIWDSVRELGASGQISWLRSETSGPNILAGIPPMWLGLFAGVAAFAIIGALVICLSEEKS